MLAAVLAAALVGAGPARAEWPLWDGKESVADYAKRAGIKDVEMEFDLSSNAGMKLVLIPAGKFMMGSPNGEKDRCEDEGPQREVTIGLEGERCTSLWARCCSKPRA
jgi:formylglycine-generating enzyme required for sulfatase activity